MALAAPIDHAFMAILAFDAATSIPDTHIAGSDAPNGRRATGTTLELTHDGLSDSHASFPARMFPHYCGDRSERRLPHGWRRTWTPRRRSSQRRGTSRRPVGAVRRTFLERAASSRRRSHGRSRPLLTARRTIDGFVTWPWSVETRFPVCWRQLESLWAQPEHCAASLETDSTQQETARTPRSKQMIHVESSWPLVRPECTQAGAFIRHLDRHRRPMQPLVRSRTICRSERASIPIPSRGLSPAAWTSVQPGSRIRRAFTAAEIEPPRCRTRRERVKQQSRTAERRSTGAVSPSRSNQLRSPI